MKRKIFVLMIGLFFSLGTFAQVRTNNNNGESTSYRSGSSLAIKYGVKVGVNMSSMSNDMSFDPGFSMGMGFRAGVFANFHWGQRTANSLVGTGLWGFQPEILYSNQTVKSDAGNVKMSYLAVPLLLKVYPTPELSFEVGPEFSYLLSTSPDVMAVDGAQVKVGDCKGLTMGVTAGLAYELDFGLVVGARYTYGFTEMAKNLKWKNSNIQVTVGWMF